MKSWEQKVLDTGRKKSQPPPPPAKQQNENPQTKQLGSHKKRPKKNKPKKQTPN